jgi:thioredoxin-related protein
MIMKKIIFAFVFVLGTITMHGQELKWETNLDVAMKISKKTKKPMLLFFTGSDWCGWCIRLQKEVLQTPEFAKWAKKNVVLVELDFPRKTPQDAAIQKTKSRIATSFSS